MDGGMQSGREQGARARMVVTRELPQQLMDRIAQGWDAWVNPDDQNMDPMDIVQAARSHAAEVLLVMAMDRIDAMFISALPDSVQVIATLSVGHDHIDLAAARARGIAVIHTPDILSDAVAEMAILLMLCAARRAREGEVMMYERRWKGWSPTQLLGRDLTGARLGLLGMGRIGRTIAQRASAAFDMPVHYHNRSRLAADLEARATYHASVRSLLEQSDILVLAAPSSPATRGILNAQTIEYLPEGAVVVNIARGDLVEDEALISALRSGRVAAAGLDVFNGEPDINQGYLSLPNVFLQPHQGSSTIGTRVRMGEMLLESIAAVRDGQVPANRLV